MKVKVRRRKPAPQEPRQAAFKSTIEVLRELAPEYGIPKTAWFERHSKERIRKEPALTEAEQAKKKSDDIITEFVVDGETFGVHKFKADDVHDVTEPKQMTFEDIINKAELFMKCLTETGVSKLEKAWFDRKNSEFLVEDTENSSVRRFKAYDVCSDEAETGGRQ